MLALAELTNVTMMTGIPGECLGGKIGKLHNCDPSSTFVTKYIMNACFYIFYEYPQKDEYYIGVSS
jgi:hypothetical protein